MDESGVLIGRAHQIAAVAGYLLGSVPWGLILTRLAGKGDIRRLGSGNIGATNVLRTGSKSLAAATLLLDGGKGALAVLLLGGLAAPPPAAAAAGAGVGFGPDTALIAGLAAVIGHNFPVWLRFAGGKGVATTFGVLLALAWPVGLAALALWLAVAGLFRYSSLAALVALAAAPLLMVVQADGPRAVAAGLLAALAVLRHHANIRRLLKGTEPKIGSRRTPPDQEPDTHSDSGPPPPAA